MGNKSMKHELFPKWITFSFEGDAHSINVGCRVVCLTTDDRTPTTSEHTAPEVRIKKKRKNEWEVDIADDDEVTIVDSIDTAVQTAGELVFQSIFQELDFSNTYRRSQPGPVPSAQDQDDALPDDLEVPDEEDEADVPARDWECVARNTYALEIKAPPEDPYHPAVVIGCLVRYADDEDGHMVFIESVTLASLRGDYE